MNKKVITTTLEYHKESRETDNEQSKLSAVKLF